MAENKILDSEIPKEEEKEPIIQDTIVDEGSAVTTEVLGEDQVKIENKDKDDDEREGEDKDRDEKKTTENQTINKNEVEGDKADDRDKVEDETDDKDKVEGNKTDIIDKDIIEGNETSDGIEVEQTDDIHKGNGKNEVKIKKY